MRSYLYYGPQDIRLEEQSIPIPQEGEILVKNLYAVTGGTDLKTFLRGHPKIIKEIPSAFGYEFIAEVYDKHCSVKDFNIGDYVVPANTVPCFNCYFCNKKEYSLCENLDFLNGAFSEYVLLPARIVKHNLYKVSNLCKLKELTLTQTLAVALHGFKRSLIKDTDKVIVYGLGPIGQTFIKLIKYFTKATVYAYARSEWKLNLAKENGADELININNLSKNEIIDLSSSLLKYGADVVIEAVGKTDAWEICLDLVRKGGLINYFGGCPKGTSISVDTFRLHYDEVKLMGVFHHSPEYMKEAFELISSNTISMRNLISETFLLDDLKKALELHEEGKVLKTLIKLRQ